MICKICQTNIPDEGIEVREMMFCTGSTYRYYSCPNCECLQIEKPELDSEKIYPTNYYSFQTFGKFSLSNWIKSQLIKYSVSKSLGSSTPFNLFGNSKRNFGSHSLKSRITKDDTILDIGCGDGGLVKALYSLGYKKITGIDPYIDTEVKVATLSLLKKEVKEMDPGKKFDIIMMHHSFEHVENPLETLQKINSLLMDKGTCIVRIPVADSFAFKFYGADWVQLDAPRHNFLHSNKSMEILASLSGLKIDAIVDDSTAFQFLGSEQYKMGIGLKDPKSYFVPFYKKFFFNKKHIFNADQIKTFNERAINLNVSGQGDQRIYYLSKI